MFLLDTNTCIRILNGSSALVAARLQATSPSEVRLSSVVKAELAYGARKSARVDDNLRLLRQFFTPFVSLPFDDRCAEEAGHPSTWNDRGDRLGPTTCSSRPPRGYDLVVVTHNTREFGRISGLRIEDWEAADSNGLG